MTAAASTERVAHVVDPRTVPAIDVLGPTIQYLTEPDGSDDQPCVMRGTIPPGVVVPMHSHADPETFLMRSGRLEGLAVAADGFSWIPIASGDVFHVPGDARHAFRNPGREPAVTIILSTAKIGRFFRELGAPVRPGAGTACPPSEEAVARFLQTAERYGYWNATPEKNAAVGLRIG